MQLAQEGGLLPVPISPPQEVVRSPEDATSRPVGHVQNAGNKISEASEAKSERTIMKPPELKVEGLTVEMALTGLELVELGDGLDNVVSASS